MRLEDGAPDSRPAAQSPEERGRLPLDLPVLREVGLVRDRKEGKQRLKSLDARGLQPVHEWTRGFERFWNERFDRLEGPHIEMRTVFPTKAQRDGAIEKYHADEAEQQTLGKLASYFTGIAKIEAR